MLRRVGLLVLATLIVGGASAPQAFVSGPSINGGGSSFSALEIEQWSAQLAGNPYNLQVNYTATGSGEGLAGFADGLYGYAGVDFPYPADDTSDVAALASGRCADETLAACLVYVPVSAAGLGFAYSLVADGAGVTDLQLTPANVCQIFTGEVTHWSALASTPGDGELAALTGLPEDVILPVVRSDGAGESADLSQYCQALDPAGWNAFTTWELANATAFGYDDSAMVAGDPISTWPRVFYDNHAAEQASGADGVAFAVEANYPKGLGSITYDAPEYAKLRTLSVASVENAAGDFTQPTPTAAQVGLASATANPSGTLYPDFNGTDPSAYFPDTYSYVLAQTGGYDTADGAVLGRYLCFAIGQGQDYAEPLGYAPLASGVVTLAAADIAKIPGAPTAADCAAGLSSVPPPALPEFPEFPVPVAAGVLGLVILGVWLTRRRMAGVRP